ncbi:MAG: hypothetical protein RL490_2576, partial [Pseudomonadota bacterium]
KLLAGTVDAQTDAPDATLFLSQLIERASVAPPA